MFFDDEY
jgi:serine/threonine protein kinase